MTGSKERKALGLTPGTPAAQAADKRDFVADLQAVETIPISTLKVTGGCVDSLDD